MDLIDTHVHLLYPDRFFYDWCAKVPALNRAFPLEDYRAAAALAPNGTRVRSLVIMEAAVPEAQLAAESTFYLEKMENDRGKPAIAAVIAGAWPESASFSSQVKNVAHERRVRGVRRVLHTMPDDLALDRRVAESLRRLPEHGFTFDLCLRPHLLPAATELAARCPEVQFVLDHCGVPDIAKGELDPWRNHLRRLAERPNVACKFSGLSSLCDAGRPMTPQVRPFFDHVLACFGPGRTMWGSDWPLCELTTGLGAWLETTATLLGTLSPADQTAIATGTARRIYRI